jgi:hypothetical protein
VKRHTALTRIAKVEAGLERIKDLEVQLAAAPVHGVLHRTLRAAIHIEADAYRKSLDTDRARRRFENRAINV